MKQINRTVAGTAHDFNVIPYYSFDARNAPLNPKTDAKVIDANKKKQRLLLFNKICSCCLSTHAAKPHPIARSMAIHGY